MKKLRDIQGPAKAANTFTVGQYAIVVRAFITHVEKKKHICLKTFKLMFSFVNK